MKKTFLLILSLILIFVTAGCKKKGGEDLYRYPPEKTPAPDIIETAYDHLIASFNTSEELLKITYRDINGKIELQYDEAESRIYTEFTINGNPSKECWPCLEFFESSGFLPTTDFSPFMGASIDVKNLNDKDFTMNLIVFDKNYMRTDYVQTVKAESGFQTITFPFQWDKVSESYDKTNILMLELWFFNAQMPVQAAFDSFRLV